MKTFFKTRTLSKRSPLQRLKVRPGSGEDTDPREGRIFGMGLSVKQLSLDFSLWAATTFIKTAQVTRNKDEMLRHS